MAQIWSRYGPIFDPTKRSNSTECQADTLNIRRIRRKALRAIIPYMLAPSQIVFWAKNQLCHFWARPPVLTKIQSNDQLVRLV